MPPLATDKLHVREIPRHSEIGEKGDTTGHLEENIFRFDIAVNESGGVREIDRPTDLLDDGETFSHGHVILSSETLPEVTASAKRVDDEGSRSIPSAFAVIKNRKNVCVPKLTLGLELAREIDPSVPTSQPSGRVPKDLQANSSTCRIGGPEENTDASIRKRVLVVGFV
jgi:hypothetical protein